MTLPKIPLPNILISKMSFPKKKEDTKDDKFGV